MSLEEITQFNTALNNYYKLKNNYESTIENGVSKLRKNTSLSKKEKQIKYEEFKKKCIICGKDGGTIFKQDGNFLIAKCGSTEQPCNLDIQLQKAKYRNILSEMNIINKNINTNKLATINTKLNLLFGFVNEATTIAEFNKLKTSLVNEVKKYKKIYDQYQNIILINDEAIQKKQDLLIYIQNFNELITKFEETKELDTLKDAIDIYLHNIKDTAEKIQKLEYIENYIEVNDDDETVNLIQRNYTPLQLQVPIDSVKNKILAYKI
jgi:hypothetical protein